MNLKDLLQEREALDVSIAGIIKGILDLLVSAGVLVEDDARDAQWSASFTDGVLTLATRTSRWGDSVYHELYLPEACLGWALSDFESFKARQDFMFGAIRDSIRRLHQERFGLRDELKENRSRLKKHKDDIIYVSTGKLDEAKDLYWSLCESISLKEDHLKVLDRAIESLEATRSRKYTIYDWDHE